MADRPVGDEVAARLAEAFGTIERDRVGKGRPEAYHAMPHGLQKPSRIA
jgi:hypothetical protein